MTSIASILSTFLALFISQVLGDPSSLVLTLDASNINETIAKNSYLVVKFYLPQCSHCVSFTPEYEKAAELLSNHDPPIVLAKVDVSEAVNQAVMDEYGANGVPSLWIIRNEGKEIHEYRGPRDAAEGVVEYLKQLLHPASTQLESLDIESISGKLFVLGIFPKLSGDEFENFQKVANKLRTQYEFSYILEEKLPHRRGQPIVRLFKPYNEAFVDFEDFDVKALEESLAIASVPLVVVVDDNPYNQRFVRKFFQTQNVQVMFFLNYNIENIDSYKSKFQEAAEYFKDKGMVFSIADASKGYTQGIMRYLAIDEDMTPFLMVYDDNKYGKENVQPDEITTWLETFNEYPPYIRSQRLPEANDGPILIVSGKSLESVLGSGKNVLLEFHVAEIDKCMELESIIDEVAASFENDVDVIIATMDVEKNDFPEDQFGVSDVPTLYLSTASGKLVKYDGNDLTAKGIIDFIQKNRDAPTNQPVDNSKDEL